jgi:cell division protein FtsB
MLLILFIVIAIVGLGTLAGLIALYDANADQAHINQHLRNEIEDLRNQMRDFLGSDMAWIYDQGRQAGKENDE